MLKTAFWVKHFMLETIRKNRGRVAALGLLVFLLPMLSVFCQSCLADSAPLKTESSHKFVQAAHSHACCQTPSKNTPRQQETSKSCCEANLSMDSGFGTFSTVLVQQDQKFVPVSIQPEVRPEYHFQAIEQGFISHQLSYTRLLSRNPVLLN